MPEINLLSQNTIDKIAAGEVVERPLSVVKELTENAIDAGSTAITVEIKEGGISFIRVTDNGCGIEKQQVKKAFLRHATSKITAIEDLSYIDSLGFRGEALSSIAAVAQVEIVTKTADDLTGIRYRIAGGQEEDMEEVGAPTGTTFIIRNLFFNTPVRKKFLKQPQTEGGYVAEMMEHLALSHPDISIKFVNHGQVRFHTSGNGNLKEVIYRIYGKEITDQLLSFHVAATDFQAEGYLGKPEVVRSNRNYEVTFVNKRYVKNEVIVKAVEAGYKPFLMQHRFPFFVLHFAMNPTTIDVNVHPSKMEIRITDGNTVYDEILTAVSDLLHGQELIPQVTLTDNDKETIAAQKVSKSKVPELKIPEPFEIKRAAIVTEEPTAYVTKPSHVESAEKEPMVKDFLHKISMHKAIDNEADTTQLNLFEEKFLTENAQNDYQIMGQIFNTYWLVAFQDKLYIIDQHAAHEKVKYERLVKELKSKKVASQLLNPPIILTLTGKEETLLQEHLTQFSAMGFELEDFGSNSYALRSIPLNLYGCNEKELFMDILDEIEDNPVQGTPEDVLQKLASMACKSAVKGNNKLSEKEIRVLLDELLTLENPYHCPHGRPTIISMSKYEIEKKFKRVL